MTTAIQKIEPEAAGLPTIRSQFMPQSLGEALQLANILAESDLAPKDFRGKAGNCLIAIQMGAELGLAPMQAIQNIAIINGRPCLWGDAVLALVQSSGFLEWMDEKTEGDVSFCTVKRKGYPEPYTAQFSTADAKAAGLLGKSGPWSQYPARMRQMRARAFALRDQFADVLKGLAIREDQEGIAVTHERQLPHSMPKRKSETPMVQPEETKTSQPKPAELEKEESQLITEFQIDTLLLLCRQHGISEERLKIQINAVLGAKTPSQILAKDFDRVCAWVEKHEVKK